MHDGVVIPVALTIAGSDPSGGAGLQADLKVFHQHRCYGCAVVTLLTVQNTRGVFSTEPLSAELVAAQLRAVLADFEPSAIKLGALGNAATVEAVADELTHTRAPIIVDPVAISTSGHTLLDDRGFDASVRRLFPLATLVTPNRAEAARLAGKDIADVAACREAARRIAGLGPGAVLVTGGHLPGAPTDVLWHDARGHELPARRVHTRHLHGTGCALSAAIAAQLAHGCSLLPAVERAKGWIGEAIAGAPGLGGGHGPLDLHAAAPSLGDEPQPERTT